MRWVILLLIIFIIALQINIWFGKGSKAELYQLKQKITQQQLINQQLREKNKKMIKRIMALKEDDDAIIERAREELGMIGASETFFMFVPSTKTTQIK